jgi:GR25 family glycosyltransferase involved in LPS biosynthesis
MNLVPYYINLDQRQDRKVLVEKEFERMDIKNAIRVSAIYNSNGAIGCLESHIKILENYEVDSQLLWICEDDIKFCVDRTILDEHIKEFVASSADIMCLGYNSYEDSEYSERFLRSVRTQTTSSYIIKSGFRKILLEFWKSILYSMKTGEDHPMRSEFDKINKRNDAFLVADQSWKILQKDYIFLIPKTRIIIQRGGYSDIEHRYVNYNV